MKRVSFSVTLNILVGVTFFMGSCNQEPKRVLIFTKTDNFRHESIEKGIEVMTGIAEELGYQAELSENAEVFTEKNLMRFHTVVFLNTSEDVLDYYQQVDFQRFIQAGGGFLGIHGAATTEYDWPWFGELVGGRFLDHPDIQEAKLINLEPDHPAMDSIPDEWVRIDEWYNFRELKDSLNIVMAIDESSYEGGKNGELHPMAWYQYFDGGISFYTALGHSIDAYDDLLIRKHLNGALRFVSEKVGKLDYSKVKVERPPEENRFTKVVLGSNLYEPTEMAVLPDDRILFIERRGNVKLYDPLSESISVIAKIEVYNEFEDGLMGLTLDPEYETNHWIYLYYSNPGEEAKQILSRFTFEKDSVDSDSEVVLLEVPTQRQECCHTGGSLAWDDEGNLYISTGDNTNPFESDGFGPMDERPGRSAFDAQSSSANSNDLRGKILRIHPEPDGTYSIPEGNLFPEGMEGTRPEIYVMGNRNPYRISIDQRSGFLYWGEVGPDAGEDSTGRGPRGHDEINQAREAGFFGWPLFVANNKPYNHFDFENQESGVPFDPQKPVNNSQNNTGLKILPPAQPALIWYPYSESEEFPLLGEGGRNAMAGPVYYSSDYSKSDNKLPAYFDGKLFIYDWMRGWIFAVTMNDQGDYGSMEPFMPGTEFNNPMDMAFGKDGVLYMLEYGSNWYSQNEDARLIRIDYNGGNRPPLVVIEVDTKKGAIPLNVNFSAENSIDFDEDQLFFSWDFGDGNISSLETPEHTFTEEGIFEVTLQVTDSEENKSSQSLEIWAGNSPPEVDLKISGNQTFFWVNKPLSYSVSISDTEDGKIEQTGNGPGKAWINFDILREGFDETEIVAGHRAPLLTLEGKTLIDGSDCLSCHKVNEKSIGPSYQEVARKYKGTPETIGYLKDKILNGGGGVWGEQVMAAHPQLQPETVEKMVEYILSLASDDLISYPLAGKFQPEPEDVTESSKLIIRASYADNGNGSIPSILVEKQKVLRFPILDGNSINESMDITSYDIDGKRIVTIEHEGWFSFDMVDFTNVSKVEISAVVHSGSITEFVILKDSPMGEQIGSVQLKELATEGPLEGTRLASGALNVDSNYYGNIICMMRSDSSETMAGAFVEIKFIQE